MVLLDNFKIAVTAGEPAGIGPELIVKIAQLQQPCPLVVIADPDLLIQTANQLRLPLTIHAYRPGQILTSKAGHLYVKPVRLKRAITPGQLYKENVPYVLGCLNEAIQGCLNHEFMGMVTGPLQKSIINETGVPFTGHTEYLAANTHADHVVMMLGALDMRVALLTTHLPLSRVAQAITPELLTKTIRTVDKNLKAYFSCPEPKIYIAGLNPHAGESGYLGTEEIDVIIPTVEKLKKEDNLKLFGPYPADSLFKKHLDQADAFLAMYHDQGLPVLKFYGFHQAVNITLGLPFIRTSVDHGTALEIAGEGLASADSLQHAIMTAHQMIKNYV